MKTHYSEADLLETYYLQPGESMPVMMHLAGCSECAARYERLERKLREAAACNAHERPETFWSRQRMLVMRGIGRERARFRGIAHTTRIAAAAALACLLGGAVVYKTLEPALQTPPAVVTTAAVAPAAHSDADLDDLGASHDPWQSTELHDLQGVVQWETWIEPKNGGKL